MLNAQITSYLRLANGIFTSAGYCVRFAAQCPTGLHPDARAFFSTAGGRLLRVPGTYGQERPGVVIFLMPWARLPDAAASLAALGRNPQDAGAWVDLLRIGAAQAFAPQHKQAEFLGQLFGASRAAALKRETGVPLDEASYAALVAEVVKDAQSIETACEAHE